MELRKIYLAITVVGYFTLLPTFSFGADAENIYSLTNALKYRVSKITNQLTQSHSLPDVESRVVYVPRQGIVIVIDEVRFDESMSQESSHQKSPPQKSTLQKSLPQKTRLSAAQKQNLNKLRESARNISHTEHHIQEQSRRLSELRKTASEVEKLEIDKQLSMLRDKASEFERKRALTKAQIDQVKHMQTEKVDIQIAQNIKQIPRQQFYSQLRNQLTIEICKDKQRFNRLSVNENVSIVMSSGGKYFEGRNLQSVMSLEVGKLEDCQFETFEY